MRGGNRVKSASEHANRPRLCGRYSGDGCGKDEMVNFEAAGYTVFIGVRCIENSRDCVNDFLKLMLVTAFARQARTPGISLTKREERERSKWLGIMPLDCQGGQITLATDQTSPLHRPFPPSPICVPNRARATDRLNVRYKRTSRSATQVTTRF